MEGDPNKFYPGDGEGEMQKGADKRERELQEELSRETDPDKQAKAARRLAEFRKSRKAAKL